MSLFCIVWSKKKKLPQNLYQCLYFCTVRTVLQSVQRQDMKALNTHTYAHTHMHARTHAHTHSHAHIKICLSLSEMHANTHCPSPFSFHTHPQTFTHTHALMQPPLVIYSLCFVRVCWLTCLECTKTAAVCVHMPAFVCVCSGSTNVHTWSPKSSLQNLLHVWLTCLDSRLYIWEWVSESLLASYK